jgi:thiol:disulfide interchange protein DsbA
MNRRDFSVRVAAASLGVMATEHALAQGDPAEGKQYVRLSTPVAVNLPSPDKKVEVIEFFWYACPHCSALEPAVEAWSRQLPADVYFHYVPVGFTAVQQGHQKLYYALEEMGQIPAMHRKVYAAIHQQGKHMATESEMVAFVSSNGLDGAKFGELFRSFSVNTKATRARQLTDAYKIDGTPTLGIHGRYYTGAALAGTPERALTVTDYLIKRSRQG